MHVVNVEKKRKKKIIVSSNLFLFLEFRYKVGESLSSSQPCFLNKSDTFATDARDAFRHAIRVRPNAFDKNLEEFVRNLWLYVDLLVSPDVVE